MKIILLQADDNLGGIGDIVNVKAGYARNYLIPNKKASIASKENIAYFSKWIESQKLKEAKSRADIELFAKQLDKMTLKFQLKAGENDKLFGSVTSQMISDEIEKLGYSIDKKEIILEESLKEIGNHFVHINLGEDLKPKVKIKIQAEK
jgi:large subunit ribosomal protein L9|tara:strand:- start:449 stop:895 length:447 start_codon:yes stop_codon:yes gene_type:complete